MRCEVWTPTPVILGKEDSPHIKAECKIERTCPACFRIFEIDTGGFVEVRPDISVKVCDACVKTPDVVFNMRAKWNKLGEDLDDVLLRSVERRRT